MNFKPKTQEELDAMGIMPAGIYQFQVANAKDRISKNGNEMIELNLEIWDNEGNKRAMFDYLLEAMPHKLHGFCTSTGMEQRYHEGNLASQHCIGKGAYVELAIQKGKEKPEGGSYPDKNEVKKYMTKRVSGSKPMTQKEQDNAFDDEIPF